MRAALVSVCVVVRSLLFRRVAARRWLAIGALLLAFAPTAQLLMAQDEAPDAAQAALTNRFVYQGRLHNGAQIVNGSCDLRFRLYDASAAGNQVGSQQVINNVAVSQGLFAVTLNAGNEFGAGVFMGERRWLDVAVRCPAGNGSFVGLTPRQELAAAPYALYAAGIPLDGNGSSTNAARSDHHHFGQSWSGDVVATGLEIIQSATGGETVGLRGVSASSVGRGVNGVASATSGSTRGVYGESASTQGHGVFGVATAMTGATIGVGGYSYSTAGMGVVGYAGAGSGTTTGVRGESASPNGRGVFGWTTAPDGAGYGVYGLSDGISGRGVYGVADSATGITYGVWGESKSPAGRGVYGYASAGSGPAYGVVGRSQSTTGRGVWGIASAGSGTTYGVYGESESTVGRGVYGYSNASNGAATGVFGISRSTSGRGVDGRATAATGGGVGVFGSATSPNGYAGLFSGRVQVLGDFAATTKTFLIDHPLDPENKFLLHSTVESSERLNLYSGNVTLDANGTAEVQVADWFSALNTDFRYQLTAIGAPGPSLYIASKLANNRFVIGGGSPGMEVSWQISGVRHDPAALASPLVVEQEKPADQRGFYLSPAAYGQAAERGLHHYFTGGDEASHEVEIGELP